MVGWGGRRAYYIAGGGTAAGYSAGAGVWLQWNIATTLAAAGFTEYNLGGVSVDAAEDPGLRRFKLGFGASVADCCGASWRLRAMHAWGHDARRLLRGWLPR